MKRLDARISFTSSEPSDARPEPTGVWTPISRPALQDEVAARIRQMIEDGALLPGSRIPERQLCAQLGVSRTPLREAFQTLGAEGLIELQPRRGAIVKRLKPDEIDHMFQVLEELEGLAGELACTLMTEEALLAIEALHEKLMTAYKRRSRAQFFKVNQEIHGNIVAAAGNPILAQVCEGLGGQIRCIRYMSQITDAQWAIAVGQHETIMRSMKARDGKAVRSMLREHLRTKRQRVKALLADVGRPKTSPGVRHGS